MTRLNYYFNKKCQLNCLYCFEKRGNNFTYKEESEQEIINNIINYFKDKKSPYALELLGGEPLLEIQKLINIITYLNNFYGKENIHFYITSNGVNVTDDFIKFLQNNKNIFLSISIDGREFANSYRYLNNKKLYDTIISNIKNLIKNNLENNLFIHIVVHNLNVGTLYEECKFFEDMGIKYFSIGVIENFLDLDEEFFDTFYNQLVLIRKNLKAFYSIFNYHEINRVKKYKDNYEYYVYSDKNNIDTNLLNRFYDRINKTLSYQRE